ncbi:hypothetical protein ALC56_04529 [Trachymyrmex septentrionalis]|uniref:Uncharacterized protein n=1 Tax=Trachymyrmex septentrionalis TaxID=34720 RepID=A0A195FMA8_9HYME|nr:hypothetical protein ALC56_04529 [Trachymyrmex septentrionalis]
MTSRTAKPKWRTRPTTNDSDDNDGYENDNDECEIRRERGGFNDPSRAPCEPGNKPGRIEKDLWSEEKGSSGEGGQERGRERGSGRATEVLRGNERVWDGKGGQTTTAWMDRGGEGREDREEG